MKKLSQKEILRRAQRRGVTKKKATYSIDAVLLADFVRVCKRSRVSVSAVLEDLIRSFLGDG